MNATLTKRDLSACCVISKNNLANKLQISESLSVCPSFLSLYSTQDHIGFLTLSTPRKQSSATLSLTLHWPGDSGGRSYACSNMVVPDSKGCLFSIFLFCCLGRNKWIHFQMQKVASCFVFLALCKTLLVEVHSLKISY